MKKFVSDVVLREKKGRLLSFFKMAVVWILAVIGLFVVGMMIYLHLAVGE